LNDVKGGHGFDISTLVLLLARQMRYSAKSGLATINWRMVSA
jgi:hypothetical protein